MLLADISFGQGLLFIFEFFLLFAWIWILISIIGDLFRDHELSGWAKAAWVLFLVFIPFLTALIYLIARPKVTAQDVQMMAQADAANKAVAGVSKADEIAKLQQLKDAGSITAEECDTLKKQTLA